jgi:hypothetical protein
LDGGACTTAPSAAFIWVRSASICIKVLAWKLTSSFWIYRLILSRSFWWALW